MCVWQDSQRPDTIGANRRESQRQRGTDMAKITKEQIHQLALIAGLQVDDDRAESIAARLASVLEALDEIPSDAMASVEPALVFAPYEATHE